MPKMKTKRSMAKRCKVTGTGKIKIFKTRRRHKLTHKNRKLKRTLTGSVVVHPSDVFQIKRMMPGI